MDDERLGFADEDVSGIVERYESLRKNNENAFFDVVEFETIIDYYLEHNDVTYAYEAAEAAYRQHPNSVSLQLRRAKVLIDKGRAVEALKTIKIIESLEPDNFEVFIIKGAALGMMGDIQGTKKYFDLALSVDRSEEPSILLSITSILYNLNHYKILLPYLEKLIALEPDYPTHLYDMAYAYERLEEYEKAIDYYNKYLNSDPYSDNAWYNVGILYNKTNRLKEAVEAYDFALAVNPENIFALFNKGNILYNIGEYALALKSYLEYLEFEEESSEALTYAAECYDKTGERSIAIKFYLEAIDLDPEFSEPWFGLGVIYLSEDKKDEAIYYLYKAVSLDNNNPEYLYYQGKAQARFLENKDAVRSFMSALKLDPFYDNVWIDLGRLIITQGLYFKVIPLLQKALKITGDVHGLRYVIASSYLYCGEMDKCYYHLSKAMLLSDNTLNDFKDLFPENLLNDNLKQLLNI